MDDLRGVIATWIGDQIDDFDRARDKRCADAALAAIKQAGFVVVHAEPTEAMIRAGDAADPTNPLRDETDAIYRAMIEASNAPT